MKILKMILWAFLTTSIVNLAWLIIENTDLSFVMIFLPLVISLEVLLSIILLGTE
jgi:hypothetical protein